MSDIVTRKIRMVVEVDIQYSIRAIGKKNLKEHMADAIISWGGCLNPDEMLFDAITGVKVGKANAVT